MLPMFKKRSLYDYIFEAEGDEGEASDTAQAATDNTQNEAPSVEESDTQGQEDAAGDDEFGNEDDFNIDTSLGDEEGGGDDAGGEDTGDTGEDTADTSSSSSYDSGTSEEEPIKANTDIFNTLTAEEQQAKIRELKNLYQNLYTSTDDLLARLNETETDEDNIEVLTRVSMVLYSLKQYIADYMSYSFGYKSFIENDIAFNRFLAILKSVTTIIDEISKIKLAKLGKQMDKKL